LFASSHLVVSTRNDALARSHALRSNSIIAAMAASYSADGLAELPRKGRVAFQCQLNTLSVSDIAPNANGIDYRFFATNHPVLRLPRSPMALVHWIFSCPNIILSPGEAALMSCTGSC